MGGGSGAATNVDSIPSPRRAALEKELRQKLTAREELRRELAFLEKGGNLLDYKFGESLISALAGDLISSDVGSLCVRNTFEANASPACLENGRYVDQFDGEEKRTGNGFENGPASSRGLVNDGMDSEAQGTEGRKNQVANKRLRQKKDEFGNGHASPRKTDQSSMCRFQVPPTCSADVREIGTCANDHEHDKGDNQLKETTVPTKEESVKKTAVEDGPQRSSTKKDGHPSFQSSVMPDPSAIQPVDGKAVTENTGTTRALPEVFDNGVKQNAEKEKDPVRLPEKEKEKEPEAEKQKTVMSAAAKKAQEDAILEEAESIKAARKQNAELARRKAGAEPPRRKSHWDFLLEEMAWLANDFMQERLWKTAAAAQVCRWTAEKVQSKKFAATLLKKNNKRIAHVLAKSVTEFWESTAALKRKNDKILEAPASRADNDANGVVPMDIDDTSADKLRPLQRYILRRSGDMESSCLPLIKVPRSVLFLVEQQFQQFPEESLFFTVPEGAFEAYRLSVERNWEALVSEKLLDNFGERPMGAELDLFADDGRAYSGRLSPKLPEDDDGMHYVPGELTFSKKKRKKISKSQTPKSFELPGSVSAYDGTRVSSPAKRPTNSSLGTIPTKRMRTSAVVARQRAATSTLSPCTQRGNASSASTNSQQEDIFGFADNRVSESDSVGPSRKVALRSKKKKKTKAFHSEFSTDAISNSHFSKTEAESQEEPFRSLEQDMLKRKNEQYSPMSSELADTPETPGSQGLAGMQPLKRTKLSKHSPDFPEAGPLGASAGAPNKLLRQSNARDKIRRNKATKGHFVQSSTNHSGTGIPWSPIEDQAILAVVHDLGPNWELVSDVLSSSSQLKGVFRKPKDCKERHKLLLDRLSSEHGDNSEDHGTSTWPGIPKGSARALLQRLQGPMEEDTVKVHLERIVNIVQNYRSKQPQNDALESLPVHQSHLNILSQYNLTLSPLDLCEHPVANSDIPGHGYPLPHPGLNLPGVMGANGMRPNSAGLGLLPIVSPNSAALNAAAARDAQRMAASMRPLSAEEQRLRYTRMVTGRNLQPQASSPGGMSLASLANSGDCSVGMLPGGTPGGLMGLNRGSLALPRPGLPGMMSPSLGSTGMMPAGLPSSGAMSAANFIKRPSQLIRVS